MVVVVVLGMDWGGTSQADNNNNNNEKSSQREEALAERNLLDNAAVEARAGRDNTTISRNKMLRHRLTTTTNISPPQDEMVKVSRAIEMPRASKAEEVPVPVHTILLLITNDLKAWGSPHQFLNLIFHPPKVVDVSVMPTLMIRG